MGSGASAESAHTRDTIDDFHKILSNKPIDCSDITTIEQAKAEIRNLRRLATELRDALKNDKAIPEKKAIEKKREAVMDKQQEGITDMRSYIPKVVVKSPEEKELLTSAVQSCILFSAYGSEEHSALVDAFSSVNVKAGDTVIKQGDDGDKFYVIWEGELDIYQKGHSSLQKVKSLKKGDHFGELALMYGTPRNATVKAANEVVLFSIDRATFRNIIAYYRFKKNEQYFEFLSKVEISGKPLGTIMSTPELEKLCLALDQAIYKEGDVIIQEGDKGDNFYIVSSGNVGVFKDTDGTQKKVAEKHQGQYFGEMALLQQETRTATCYASSDTVTCLTLTREDFIDMMGSVEDLLSGKKSEQKEEVQAITPAALMNVQLTDFKIMRTLGVGAFGRVKLCHLPQNDEYYAIKCQPKRAIVESGLQDHVINELKIMKKINHPYICKMNSALQDSKYIYFVMELLQGGELFSYLRSRKPLSEQGARFYASIVVYAFAQLHSQKIAYRDLKPENLVMDTHGYIKLVDFGLAKQLLSGKTWTLCGTPDYLAPEIILNEGHDLAVDYWALGILIYEMCNGAPPFYAEDPMEIYEKILAGNPTIPASTTRNLSDLLRKLLRPQQGKRLGNTRGSTAAVIKHKWFNTLDWAQVENGTMVSPYKPNIKTTSDVSNFDQFDEVDAEFDSDWNPDLLAD